MKRRILVVDDEPDIVEFLTDILEEQGYGVRSAQDVSSAQEKLHEQRPDLILLDLQMPNQTGTDLYRQLRNHKDFKDIPVIVVSGLAGRRVAVSGKVPVIDKPIDEVALMAEINRLLAA